MIQGAIDPVWEKEIYGRGQHFNRYPFDCVVAFVFRNYSRSKPKNEVRILEVGCGAGNNLWFAAREGFGVTGVDGSPSAIEYAKRRFTEECLNGDFRVSDFSELPFPDEGFDMVIDRCSLTCCGRTVARRAVSEVRRVLVKGGRFLLNPYSSKHSSYAAGQPGVDGLTIDIKGGSLVGVGKICFYAEKDLDVLLGAGWKTLSVQHLDLQDRTSGQYTSHAEWRMVVEKT